jgi:F-type H+-transporting ATPase subunit a
VILGVEFPPLSHVVQWPTFTWSEGWGPFAMNKVVLVYFAAAILTMLIFLLGRKKELVPSGGQNFAEIVVDFIEDGVIMQTIGPKGLKYAPLFLALFLYIFFNNIFEVIPGVQMPGTARIALPMFLAVLTWFVYNGAGIKEHGPLGYLRAALMPSGVPKLLYIIIIPIEFVSTFLVRPFSLMVRLFANLLAGHILLVTFTVLSAGLWRLEWTAIFLPLPVLGVVFFVAFEVLVSLLQAYVFTLLAGVYIGASISHDH